MQTGRARRWLRWERWARMGEARGVLNGRGAGGEGERAWEAQQRNRTVFFYLEQSLSATGTSDTSAAGCSTMVDTLKCADAGTSGAGSSTTGHLSRRRYVMPSADALTPRANRQ